MLDPQRRAVFLDTDACGEMAETTAAETVANGGEAALLVRVAAALVEAGLPAADIGAISPYRAQVSAHSVTCSSKYCQPQRASKKGTVIHSQGPELSWISENTQCSTQWDVWRHVQRRAAADTASWATLC